MASRPWQWSEAPAETPRDEQTRWQASAEATTADSAASLHSINNILVKYLESSSSLCGVRKISDLGCRCEEWCARSGVRKCQPRPLVLSEQVAAD